MSLGKRDTIVPFQNAAGAAARGRLMSHAQDGGAQDGGASIVGGKNDAQACFRRVGKRPQTAHLNKGKELPLATLFFTKEKQCSVRAQKRLAVWRGVRCGNISVPAPKLRAAATHGLRDVAWLGARICTDFGGRRRWPIGFVVGSRPRKSSKWNIGDVCRFPA